jgi:hypothetical protein
MKAADLNAHTATVRGKSGGRQREVERGEFLALPPERCNVRYVDRFGGNLFRLHGGEMFPQGLKPNAGGR